MFLCMVVILYILFFFILIVFLSSVEGGTILFSWLPLSSLTMILDKYSLLFSGLLGLVSSCVFLWSYYYMDTEYHYRRFMGLVITFVASMLCLIFISSPIFTIIGWDGLGISSFLLVIFFNNRKSLSSGMITALTNRVGDCFLVVFIGVLLVGSSNLFLCCYLFILLSMTKSAQYPFSSWLPAAMAAPTPVSALVHSSTLVTAGVYLMLRFDFVDYSVLLAVGSLTMTMAGACACSEIDFKKIVALSTLSQLGVMFVALGVCMKSFCFFHLLSHAMFKALLFMCVGFLIHTIYGSQDSRGYNGMLFSGYPSFLIILSNLALCGFPFMAGFYSKDSILESFYNNGLSGVYWVVFLIGVGLTTCYSFKMMSVGLQSNSTSEISALSSWVSLWFLKTPLTILGSMSTVGGYFLISEFLTPSICLESKVKILPLFMISLGILIGILLSRFMFKENLSNMLFLTPLFQESSNLSVSGMETLKSLDSGFLEWVGPSGVRHKGLDKKDVWEQSTQFLVFPFFLLMFFFWWGT